MSDLRRILGDLRDARRYLAYADSDEVGAQDTVDWYALDLLEAIAEHLLERSEESVVARGIGGKSG